MPTVGSRALASLLVVLVLGACAEGTEATVTDDWTGATALTGSEDHATGVATDGTVAIFSTGGSQVGENAVRAVPLDGSGPSRILTTAPLDAIPSSGLAVEAGTVYVAVGDAIAALPVGGGDASSVVTDRPTSITSLAVQDGYVWWTASALNQPDNAEVARAPLAGGPVEVLAGPDAGRGSYTSVHPDGSGGAYVGSPAGLLRVAPGVEPEVVVSDDEASGAVTRIAVDDERVYGVVAGGRSDLFAVPRGGGDLVQLARDADNTKDLLALDGGVAFFVGDDLRWAPGSGGGSTVLTSGPYSDGALALAGDRIVFPADWRLWTIPVAAP